MSYRHGQYSDPHPLPSDQPSFPDIPDFFSSVHSDEEVILASTRPKKRAGRKKFKETRHPVYRGVRQRNGNRWVCELRAPNNKARIWLGTYPTAEMAARAHDVAALALRGRMACLNFADSAWRLPVPVSTDTRDIQQAAAEAAEAFRPQVSGSEVTVESSTKSNHQYDEVSNVANEQIKSGDDKEAGEKSEAYVDEEAVFDMPRLLANMAEGLLLPPPCTTSSWEEKETDDCDDCDLSLWSYSI